MEVSPVNKRLMQFVALAVLVTGAAPTTVSANAMPPAPPAPALIPDMLILGGLKIFDNILGGIFPPRRSVQSAVGVAMNVYLDDHYGDCECEVDKLTFVGPVDPIASGQFLGYGDRIVLEVIPRKSGPMGRQIEMWIDHARIFHSKIEGGRGIGIVKGNPFIRVRELREGARSVVVSFGGAETAEFVITRFDIRRYHQVMEDEDSRINLAGVSHAMYPGHPVYTAMVGDVLRAFNSEAEAAVVLEQLNRLAEEQARNEPIGQHGQQPSQRPAQSGPIQPEVWKPAAETVPLKVFGVRYKREQVTGLSPNEIYTQLRSAALSRDQLPVGRPLVIGEGETLFLLIQGEQAFKAELIDPDGKILISKQSTAKDGKAELIFPLAYSPGATDNNLVIDGRWRMSFQRGE
jgi:hypothetical protein